MRHSIAISAVALAVVAFATPGEAQTFNRNGGQSQRSFGNAPQNGGFSQRSFQGPSTQSSNVGNRTFRSVQPPPPSSQAGNTGNVRPFSVQPPAPGNQAGNQAGNQGNARSFSIQPPPSSGAQRSAQPPIGNSIRPPIASPNIPTATATAATVGAAAATAGVATAARAQQGAAGNDTAQVGQPIDPTASSSVSVPTSATAQVGQPAGAATNGDLPPLEMLASVGEPIMPVNQGATAGATQAGQVVEGGFVRTGTVMAVEHCTVPIHHVTYHRVYRRW